MYVLLVDSEDVTINVVDDDDIIICVGMQANPII